MSKPKCKDPESICWNVDFSEIGEQCKGKCTLATGAVKETLEEAINRYYKEQKGRWSASPEMNTQFLSRDFKAGVEWYKNNH